MKRLLTSLLILILNACSPQTNYKSDPILSPDSNLNLSAYVNRLDNSEPNFALVVLSVEDKKNGQITDLQTRLGDVMKWAIGWYDNNTIVAHSSDIGTRSWRYVNGEYEELSVTPEMSEYAEQLLKEKYPL